MASTLLATKLRIPPAANHVVARPRLVDVLDEAVPAHKLTAVSAPAGFGKTTLVAQWARASKFPVIWISLSEDDNDPIQLLRYILSGWERIDPAIAQTPLAILLGSLMPDRDAVLNAFLNLANELTDHLVIVLDDYHLIPEPLVHELLTYLLDNLPPQLHFVLTSRDQPPLPIARYRARRELFEIQTIDLAFNLDESRAFLDQTPSITLPDDEIASLHRQLEGWAAGLQLAAITLREGRERATKLSITGRHRYIADYLREDVLANLPGDFRQFLLETSILDHLNADLCATVTARRDCQQILEALEQQNLFIIALDDNREWFRIHRIFASFLQQELGQLMPEIIPQLHQRAALWYLNYDLAEPAFRHALQADNPAAMIELGERYFFAKFHRGEFRDLYRWLDQIPEEWQSAHPVFGLIRGGLHYATGDLESCRAVADELESRLTALHDQQVDGQLARVTALRCFIACAMGDLTAAQQLGNQALVGLDPDDVSFRADIYNALGDTYRSNSLWEESRDCYLRLLDMPESRTLPVIATIARGALADLDMRRGHLRSAWRNWDLALNSIEDRENWAEIPLPVSGWAHIRMAEILLEWNRLDEAAQHLAQGIQRAELGGDTRAIIQGHLVWARLALDRAELETATGHLEIVRPLIQQSQMPDWKSNLDICQVELWIAQNKLNSAVEWSAAISDREAATPRERLALARVLIANGDATSQALEILRPLAQTAKDEGRTAVHIEALVLQALVHQQSGADADALTSIALALQLAEPEGFLRTFVKFGLPMGRLLQEAKARNIMPEYVSALIECFPTTSPGTPSAEPGLPEPLTQRELEILELIAFGLTNLEIGERLYISAQTVKTHTSNIYSKLAVHSRTAAAARARDLNLI